MKFLSRCYTAIFTLSCLCFISTKSFSSTTLPLLEYETGIILSIHGSNTLGAKLMPQWAQDYMAALGLKNIRIEKQETENEYVIHGQHLERDYSIHIAAHGSSTGFKALHASEAHIAMSSRPIKTKEVETLHYLGDMRSFSAEKVVAIDGLAIIVHKNNPIASLTTDEIAQIFSGEITNWSQIGGKNAPISRYARDENSGTWDTFNSLVLKKQSNLDKSTQRFESNDQLSDLVANDIGGIGFVGLSSVRNAKPIAVADGNTTALNPDTLSVATEDYPLSRRLYLYIAPEKNTPRANDFIQFIQASNNQKRVDEIGFVSLNPITRKITPLIEGPADYKQLVQNAERLSINFRFKEGSAYLDNRALRDIERIAEYINHQKNKNKHIQLIGFGDSKQTEERAVLLSRLRASAVKSALHKQGVFTLPVSGFGAYMPIASQYGINKEKNQRVEVWIFNAATHPHNEKKRLI